jgi:hypothetical protein
MGKLMRSQVVRHLRESAAQTSHLSAGAATERSAPEINVCCHGQEAGEGVRSCYKSLSMGSAHKHMEMFLNPSEFGMKS